MNQTTVSSTTIHIDNLYLLWCFSLISTIISVFVLVSSHSYVSLEEHLASCESHLHERMGEVDALRKQVSIGRSDAA